MNRGEGPLCADGRMLGLTGSGTATYAAALARAQRAIDPAARLLADRAGSFGSARDGRTRRWLGALWPGARHAKGGSLDGGSTAFVGRDLFRLAQVWFDVHRRLLPVRVPGPPGIMHWSYPVPLQLAGWHNLYTVHDAIPLIAPELTPIEPARHRRLLRAIVGSAARLVTVSASAGNEIARALELDPAWIVDCGQGVDVAASLTALPSGLTAGRYLLAVGTVEPRKNIARLVEAWRRSGVDLPLVLAGQDGWRADGLVPAGEAGLVRLKEVDQPTLAALLANARALLMPSLAEGFGLPVIEAMAAGTPVLTSAGGALEEVAGGAALLVDPDDTDAIAAGIRRLACSNILGARLRAAGLVNARRYTPEVFAARLAALYAAVREET